jgi:hypothetical protein
LICWLDNAEDRLLLPPSGLDGAICAANLRQTNTARRFPRKRGFPIFAHTSLPTVDNIIAAAVAVVHSAPEMLTGPGSYSGLGANTLDTPTIGRTYAAARHQAAKGAVSGSDTEESLGSNSDLVDSEDSVRVESDDDAYSDTLL